MVSTCIEMYQNLSRSNKDLSKHLKTYQDLSIIFLSIIFYQSSYQDLSSTSYQSHLSVASHLDPHRTLHRSDQSWNFRRACRSSSLSSCAGDWYALCGMPSATTELPKIGKWSLSFFLNFYHSHFHVIDIHTKWCISFFSSHGGRKLIQ